MKIAFFVKQWYYYYEWRDENEIFTKDCWFRNKRANGSYGAVLIEGCKWCGKSTTGSYHAKSIIEFQNPDRKQEYDDIKSTKPSLFLNGEKPRMFDEWQMYPVVWDSVRCDVYHSRLKG